MGSLLSEIEGETFQIPLNNSLMTGFEKRLGKDGSEHLCSNGGIFFAGGHAS